MEIARVLPVDEIDLSYTPFWLRPAEEREGAFATLRAERPVPWMIEHAFPPAGTSSRAWILVATRHADILAASRQPELFSSAAGATSITSLPREFNEFFGGMINMDDPRHGAPAPHRLPRLHAARPRAPRPTAFAKGGRDDRSRDRARRMRFRGGARGAAAARGDRRSDGDPRE